MVDNSSAPQKSHHDIYGEIIRWIGFFSGITIGIIILLFPNDWVTSGKATSIGFQLVIISITALPAFAAAFLSLTRESLLSQIT